MRAYAVITVFVAGLAAAQPDGGGCPDGQSTTADTAGHCCWSGQVWSASRSRCVGIPTSCPDGQRASDDACVTSCPEGMAIGEETAGQCCWPEQVWSTSRSRCVGAPRCPPSLRAEGEQCVTACPRGQLITADTEGHCCWPEQVWSPSRSVCLGAPRCPAGWSASRDERCVEGSAAPPASPPAAAERHDEPKPLRRTRVSLLAGVYFAEGTGAAVALPIRIGVATVAPRERFQGTAVVLAGPVLWAVSRPRGTRADLGIGGGLDLGAGWEQLLGPVEVLVRGGLALLLDGQTAVSGTVVWSVDFKLRAVAGLRFAVPSGESTKFLLGADVFFGAGAFGVAWVGAGF